MAWDILHQRAHSKFPTQPFIFPRICPNANVQAWKRLVGNIEQIKRVLKAGLCFYGICTLMATSEPSWGRAGEAGLMT